MKLNEKDLKELVGDDSKKEKGLADAINNLAKVVSTPPSVVVNPSPINNIIDIEKIIKLMPKPVDNTKELKEISNSLTKIVETMNDKPNAYEMEMRHSSNGRIEKVVVKSIKL